MWISPDGEMPVETTGGRPVRMISSAMTSAQCVTGRLGSVDKSQPQRVEAGYLASKLGANQATGAGYEDRLASEEGANGISIELDWLAAEYVLDLDISKTADGDCSAQQFV